MTPVEGIFFSSQGPEEFKLERWNSGFLFQRQHVDCSVSWDFFQIRKFGGEVCGWRRRRMMMMMMMIVGCVKSKILVLWDFHQKVKDMDLLKVMVLLSTMVICMFHHHKVENMFGNFFEASNSRKSKKKNMKKPSSSKYVSPTYSHAEWVQKRKGRFLFVLCHRPQVELLGQLLAFVSKDLFTRVDPWKWS